MARPTGGYFIGDKKPQNRVPSVTTVLGAWGEPGGLVYWAWKRGMAGLPRWPEEAVNAGNLAHQMVEDHLHGKMPTIPDGTDPEAARAAEAGFESYLEWREGVDFQATATELPLVHRDLRYAGTLDAVGLAHGKFPCLCDWKLTSGTQVNHVLQLAAYMELYEHNQAFDATPETPPAKIERFYSLRFGKGDPDAEGGPDWGGDFHHHSFTRDQMETALGMFKHILEAYRIDKTVKRWVK